MLGWIGLIHGYIAGWTASNLPWYVGLPKKNVQKISFSITIAFLGIPHFWAISGTYNAVIWSCSKQTYVYICIYICIYIICQSIKFVRSLSHVYITKCEHHILGQMVPAKLDHAQCRKTIQNLKLKIRVYLSNTGW